jgi:hypothetical protein
VMMPIKANEPARKSNRPESFSLFITAFLINLLRIL